MFYYLYDLSLLHSVYRFSKRVFRESNTGYTYLSWRKTFFLTKKHQGVWCIFYSRSRKSKLKKPSRPWKSTSVTDWPSFHDVSIANWCHMICTIDLSTMTPLLDHNHVLLPAASIRPLYIGLDSPTDISVLIECTRKVHFHQRSSQAQQRYPTKTRLMTRGRKLDNKLDSSSFLCSQNPQFWKFRR